MKEKFKIVVLVITICLFFNKLAIASSTADCEVKAERMIANINSGDYASARLDFDEKLSAQLSEAKIQQVWQQISIQVGKLENILESYSSLTNGLHLTILVLQFEKSLLDAKVYCDEDGKISSFFLAPHEEKYEYIKPNYVISDNFTETDIVIGTQNKLAGKLTLPKGGSKFPCIILVHGSGPNDMDESIGPNKPFKDLAWGLSSRGIAVLRYNKRTYKNADLDIENLTLKEEVIDDVLEAYNFAIKHENIDPERVIVLGHSLGGMCLPRIAGRLTDAAGFISMAGTLRSFKDIIPDQYNYLFGLDEEYSMEEEEELSKLYRQIKHTFSSSLDENFPSDSLVMGIYPKYWIDYKEYDFVKAAENISQPMLIMQGDRDYQITTEDDFSYWKLILKDKHNTTYKLYDDLNHLFISGEGMPNPDEYYKAGHVDEQVIIDIISWRLRIEQIAI